jgi:hypothetical protein
MKKAFLVLIAASILTLESHGQTATFCDDFNRPDGPVINGWLNSAANRTNMEIQGYELTSTAFGNDPVGIYRPMAIRLPVRVRATIKETTAHNPPAGSRFDSGFHIFDANGPNASDVYLGGYGLRFERTSAWTQSYVSRVDGGYLDRFIPSFQFVSVIHVDFTIHQDGSITGTVSEGGNSSSYSFPPRVIVSAGPNFKYEHFPRQVGGLYPRLDDLSIGGSLASCDTVGSGCGGLSLNCNQVPVLGRSFSMTLGGNIGVGVVLVDLSPVGSGVQLPAPPFQSGCSLYIGPTNVTLGITALPTSIFSIAIPNVGSLLGLPVGCQGVSLGAGAGWSTSNGLNGVVGDC